MLQYDSAYGKLNNYLYDEFHPNGRLKQCLLTESCLLTFRQTSIIPYYQEDGIRKKFHKSVTFYESGAIESVILQSPVVFQTSAGEVPAEMVTFYESGALKRLFPVFSFVNTYWTEKDEKELSPELDMTLPFGTLRKKLINLMFYETGEVHSLTLWPNDKLDLHTKARDIQCRIGVSFYRGGGIRSLEPCPDAVVSTPLGNVPVYDPDAIGADGSKNSLLFDEHETVCSLITSLVQVRVCSGTAEILHAPQLKNSSYFDDRQAVVPMKIRFQDGKVRFGYPKSEVEAEYVLDDITAVIEPFDASKLINTCEYCLD